jgi:hypothetical protein
MQPASHHIRAPNVPEQHPAARHRSVSRVVPMRCQNQNFSTVAQFSLSETSFIKKIRKTILVCNADESEPGNIRIGI